MHLFMLILDSTIERTGANPEGNTSFVTSIENSCGVRMATVPGGHLGLNQVRGAPTQAWALHLAPEDLRRPSKTGVFDETIMLD